MVDDEGKSNKSLLKDAGETALYSDSNFVNKHLELYLLDTAIARQRALDCIFKGDHNKSALRHSIRSSHVTQLELTTSWNVCIMSVKTDMRGT